MKESLPELSVVIVNWNTRDILKDCLTSLCNTVGNLAVEIIVVDNGSSDDSVHLVQENFPEVIVIQNKTNRGYAAANNQGIVRSRGQYVLLLNSDTIILEQALERSLAFLKNCHDAGAVGCKLLNPDRSVQPSCFNFFSFWKHVILKTFVPKFFIPDRARPWFESRVVSWDYNSVRCVDYVSGAFLLMRKEVLDTIGLLDESFFMYAEEADLCMRIKKAGWCVYFFPEAFIVHIGGASAQQKGIEIMHRTVSDIRFRKKHYHPFIYIGYRIFLVLFLAAQNLRAQMLDNRADQERLKYKIKGMKLMEYHVLK